MARVIHGINAPLACLILVGKTHTQDWIYEAIKRRIEDLFKKEGSYMNSSIQQLLELYLQPTYPSKH